MNSNISEEDSYGELILAAFAIVILTVFVISGVCLCRKNKLAKDLAKEESNSNHKVETVLTHVASVHLNDIDDDHDGVVVDYNDEFGD